MNGSQIAKRRRKVLLAETVSMTRQALWKANGRTHHLVSAVIWQHDAEFRKTGSACVGSF